MGLKQQEELRARLAYSTNAADVDLWIAPSAAGPAPRGLGSTGSSIMCAPWSYAGWPALSLPAGRNLHGLPLGLQCVGPAHSDEHLIKWAEPIAAALAGRLS